MALFNKTINDIFTGVSQLEEKQENYSDEQVNTNSTLSSGVSKREPSEYISGIDIYTTNMKDDFYYNFKNSNNNYFIRINEDSNLNINDINGNLYPIVYDEQSSIDYLTSTNPKESFSLAQTIENDTEKNIMVIANKDVKVLPSYHTSGGSGETYVDNDPYYALLNFGNLDPLTTSDSGKTVTSTTAYRFYLTIDGTTFNIGYNENNTVNLTLSDSYPYFVKEINASGIYEATQVSAKTIKVKRKDGKQINSITHDWKVRNVVLPFYRTEWSNYNFQLTTQVFGGTSITQVGSTYQGFVVIENGLPELQYNVYLREGNNVYQYNYTSTTVGSTYNTNVIANDLETQINAATGTTGFVATRLGSSLKIKRNDELDFEVGSTDGKGDTYIKTFKDRVNSFQDLPPRFFDYVNLKVQGEDSEIGYYVIYRNGVWDEYKKLGIKDDIDSSTSPRKIEVLYNEDIISETNREGIYFKVSKIDFVERLVGDEKSAPTPSFVDDYINKVFVYQNRLGILSGKNVVFSRIDDLYDFYPKSAKVISDDDPIDVKIVGSNVLKNVSIYNTNLLLFDDNNQFLITSNSKPFTPTNVVILPTTSYNTNNKITPINDGPNVYFMQRKNNYSKLLSYFILENSISNSANDLSVNIPEYIESNLKKMVISNEFNTLFILPEDSNLLYVMNYRYQDGKMVFNSWQKWEFDNKIFNIEEINGQLYMFMNNKNSNNILVKIDLEQRNLYNKFNLNTNEQTSFVFNNGVYNAASNETEFNLSISDLDLSKDYIIYDTNDNNISANYIGFENNFIYIDGDYSSGIRIEYKIDENDLSFDVYLDKRVEIVPTINAGKSEYVIPYNVDLDNDSLASISVDDGFDYYEYKDETSNGNTLILDGEYGSMIIGYKYNMLYDFPTFYMRDKEKNTVEEGRMQIRYCTVHYNNSGKFKIETSKTEKTMTGKVIGLSILNKNNIDSGEFRVGIYNSNKKADIKLTSESFQPVNFNKYNMTITYTTRSRGL